MSLGDRYRERLQQMITALRGTVPGCPSPTDEENYTLQLLDALTASLSINSGSDRSVTYRARTPADAVNHPFFIADRAYRIARVDYIHVTPETTSADLYATVAIASGSALPAAATPLDIVFNCKHTGHLVQTRNESQSTIGGQPANLTAGNRLCMKYTFGTPTELAGVCCVVTLRPI